VQGQSLLAELLQGLVALVIVVPTMLIVLYQVVNSKPVVIPDVLAGFDGVVITFYFARVGLTQVAHSVANGTLQGVLAGQTSAANTKPTV
jgi:hypothetical protein